MPQPKLYTFADALSWGEDSRTELLYGTPMLMAPPTRAHQKACGALFAELYQFSDPDYFDSHEQMYLYLEDNVLTYEIFAAYERENNSLIRTYDFTYLSGCDQFLKDMYGIRSMNMMIRSGWEDVTPYHFLVTLTTSRGKDSDSQFVVLAALIEDPAGTIDRAVME